MFSREEVIDYLREYEKFSPSIVERELKVPLDSKFILSIIGPRRAGKTYYLLSLRNKVKNALYLNFEDTRLSELSHKEIKEVIRIFLEIYGKNPKYLLLDEIQEIEKWESVIRELHDLNKYKIFLTGSSSKLLSKEIATQLRGRTLSFLLLPLSFREFLFFKKVFVQRFLSKDEETKLKNFLIEYLEYGGFPEIVESKEKSRILKEYSDLILFRDFIERHKLRNFEVARLIHSFIIRNFSKEISIKSLYNKIKSISKVSKDAIYSYVSKLADTTFFFFVRRYSQKVHLRESWPKKIYICDTGLTKVLKFSEDLGKLMENTVFLELLRKTNENPLLEIFYFKDSQQREVDFVLKEGLKVKQLIQVTYASAIDEIEKREIRSLIKASELLKCRNLSIITWDFEEEVRINNLKIKCIPLWKWALGIQKI